MPTITKLFIAEGRPSTTLWRIAGSSSTARLNDVSSYLDDHLGGEDVILQTVGKDGTDGFEDAGHSKEARELLETFCIGRA